MHYLLLLFLGLSLAANEELIDIYQKKGIQGLEKVFDNELTSKQYWEKRLQNIDTRFGYFEGINYILACDKNETSLKLYTKNKSNVFDLNESFSAFVGEKNGDKQKEGDLKTPIGVYKLIQKLDNVDSFYGPLAFVTSYPNTYDRVQGKNGSGIWVHGLPLDRDRNGYTRGCIAINNSNLRHLEEKIEVDEALVYIDQEAYPKVKKEELVTLLSQLYTWRQAWKENDIENYLNFYDPSFKRNDGLSIKKFKKYKERVFSKNESKQILFTNINILPYPMAHKKDIFLISFSEQYNSRSYQFNGEKELYVHLDNQNFTILTEK